MMFFDYLFKRSPLRYKNPAVEGVKFTEAEDVKVRQLYPERNEEARKVQSLSECDVEFLLYPGGQRGCKVTHENGKEVYYRVDFMGRMKKLKKVGDYFVEEDFNRKLERFFGISDQMRINVDKRIDYIHAAMFIGGFGLLTAATYFIVKWLLY